MAAAAVIENRGLCYGFMDLYEVWCGDAKWASGSFYHFGPLSPGIAGTADS